MTRIFTMAMMVLTLGIGFVRLNVALAELKSNPDKNTLWIEDGKKVQVGVGSSNRHWNTQGLNVSDASEEDSAEGILFESPNSKKHATGRYVHFDPAFPYLVWEISQVIPGKGYQGFCLHTLQTDHGLFFSMVSHLKTGLFTVNTSYYYPVPKVSYLRIDLYNTQITMKYLKLVKTPANYLEISSPLFATKKGLDLGDEVTFKLVLAETAEDVSLRFFDSYTMPQLTINGSQTLQLKAEDEDQKIWTRKLKFDSCTGAAKPGIPFSPGGFIVKAVILGGKLGMPIWTTNPVEFRINPATK